ncbi:unnamed protein product [Clonostachys rhizophaga]|uniref:Mannan endo-1,4-beta-mannosidase n=1 Tax=Clonostachys rhizophaga TaxID=160324 RepID=A0A9N9V5M8_9HYPO|nr:unnamed protein product [Clonostachys rhizophaga]
MLSLKVTSFGFLALAVATFAAPVSDRAIAAAAQTLEAEDAVLTGTQILTELTGYTGTGYVGGFDESSDKITFTANSDALTLYDVSIRYAGIYGAKRTTLVLNGGASSEVQFEETTTWASVSGGQLLLNQGSNTIDIVSNWGWYLIDSITLTPSEPRPPHNINSRLINQRADIYTRKLYNYLRSIYGKKILSGQQGLDWATWIQQQTGKFPALVSLDLMDYSPSRVEHGTTGTAIEEAISHAKNGGIISILWHWNAPTGLYDTEENPWWSGFYTRATDFNIATALADTTNANYTLILRDIDAIAVQLKRLQSAHIAVLFRPLHESEGGWFWWGAQGPEPSKKLWALLYNRLTNYHKLNNLIWVWNSIAESWYPGDSIVDILSADVYSTGNGPMSTQYGQLIELGKDKKLIAASEVGGAPLPDQLIAYEAHWLWFAVWGDTFINNPAYNPIDVLKTIFNHKYVLTLDEIQGWQN